MHSSLLQLDGSAARRSYQIPVHIRQSSDLFLFRTLARQPQPLDFFTRIQCGFVRKRPLDARVRVYFIGVLEYGYILLAGFITSLGDEPSIFFSLLVLSYHTCILNLLIISLSLLIDHLVSDGPFQKCFPLEDMFINVLPYTDTNMIPLKSHI